MTVKPKTRVAKAKSNIEIVLAGPANSVTRTMSRIVPRCSCGGELAITGEMRSDDGWRTGFKLKCKQCGKEWTYSGGVYRQA